MCSPPPSHSARFLVSAVRDTSDSRGGDRLRGVGHVRASVGPGGGQRHPDRMPAVPDGGGPHPHGPGPSERVRLAVYLVFGLASSGLVDRRCCLLVCRVSAAGCL